MAKYLSGDALTDYVVNYPSVKYAVHRAALLCQRWEDFNPSAEERDEVTRNYAAYIIEHATI